MYSYIKGIVEEIYLDRIILENNGIGYEINVSSFTAQSVQKGKSAKIFTKLIVREDDMSLCGFSTQMELEMFKLLTSVSKIGPKVGLGILSCATPPQLSAYILSEDQLSSASATSLRIRWFIADLETGGSCMAASSCSVASGLSRRSFAVSRSFGGSSLSRPCF